MTAQTPADLWRRALRTDPVRPFITAYDDATGGRVELSFTTFDNWVAKTANLIVDGLGAEPGERVALALPVHWQSLVWLTACWSAGVVAVPADAQVPDADIVVADADRLTAALDSGAREVVGASLHPLGAPLADCPPGVMDYAVEVRGFADQFSPMAPLDPAATALVSDEGYSGAALVEHAAHRAELWELSGSDRVAVLTSDVAPLATLGVDFSRFLAPVFVSAALVITSGSDSVKRESRLRMERATAVVGAWPEGGLPAGDIRTLK